MSIWKIYVDENGKRRVRHSDEYLKEVYEKKKKNEESKKRLDKKNNNEYWLNRWLYKRRVKRQEKFIGYRRSTVPKERWNEMSVKKFLVDVDIRESDECWNWMASLTKKGYGQPCYHGRHTLAHRLSYMLFYGDIPEGVQVLHMCDNRRCVNPEHLKLGTNDDNIKDKVDRGRSCSGENNVMYKLTDEEVKNMREEYSVNKMITKTELSKKYEISITEAGNIINNKRRKDSNYTVPMYKNGHEGENNGNSKLTWEDVNKIREMYKTGKYSHRTLAKKYNVSSAAIGYITKNKTWIV